MGFRLDERLANAMAKAGQGLRISTAAPQGAAPPTKVGGFHFFLNPIETPHSRGMRKRVPRAKNRPRNDKFLPRCNGDGLAALKDGRYIWSGADSADTRLVEIEVRRFR